MRTDFSFCGLFNSKGKLNKTKSNSNNDLNLAQNIPFETQKALETPNAYYSKIEANSIASIDLNIHPKHRKNNYIGCLIGGSIGDALGWPVEFYRLSSIRKMYGEKGITDLKKIGGKAEITDDTQMTIFTADGLLKSATKDFNKDKLPDMSIIYNSYQNWLNTQTNNFSQNSEGWISNIASLYAQRAPGTTCIGSLEGNIAGSIEKPLNNSKGCGGVMRTAPAGLMYFENPKIAFEVGARCAALTHGSPSAYLPAGVHSCIIANIIKGETLEKAIDNSIEILKTYKGNEDTLKLIEEAKTLAFSDVEPDNAIKMLGEGWHGDEAIAISIYCALKCQNNFKEALIMAVNHNGDSDSTGAIVGNILGAYLGLDAIPLEWRNSVELTQELRQLACDLYCKPSEIENSSLRYPVN